MCSQPSQNLPDTCPVDSQNQLTPALTPPSTWGFLYPCLQNQQFLPLLDDVYVIGRASHCCRNLKELGDRLWQQISKEHFRIRRVVSDDSSAAIYLDDLSSNGTFVNEIRVGKGKSRLLRSNDHISCILKKTYVFVYIDNEVDTLFKDYPSAVTSTYTMSKILGEGGYGKVRLVFKKDTGQGYAMKIIQKSNFCTSQNSIIPCKVNKVQREIDILKKLDHAFVIKFHDVFDQPERVYIVTELVSGGPLFERIAGGKALSESDAKYYFYQLALAIKYLHSEGIIHRDVKLENILLSSNTPDCVIKLADFGLSKFVDSESILRTFCGTPMYIAPEILRNNGQNNSYDTQADIWSMGVVLYMCLSGTSPFMNSKHEPTLQEQILRGYYSFPEKQMQVLVLLPGYNLALFFQRYWTNVSCEAIHLIRSMLIVDPKKRIKIDQILKHTWLQDKSMKERIDLAMIQHSNTSSTSSKNNSENEEPEAKRAKYSADNENNNVSHSVMKTNMKETSLTDRISPDEDDSKSTDLIKSVS